MSSTWLFQFLPRKSCPCFDVDAELGFLFA